MKKKIPQIVGVVLLIITIVCAATGGMASSPGLPGIVPCEDRPIIREIVNMIIGLVLRGAYFGTDQSGEFVQTAEPTDLTMGVVFDVDDQSIGAVSRVFGLKNPDTITYEEFVFGLTHHFRGVYPAWKPGDESVRVSVYFQQYDPCPPPPGVLPLGQFWLMGRVPVGMPGGGRMPPIFEAGGLLIPVFVILVILAIFMVVRRCNSTNTLGRGV